MTKQPRCEKTMSLTLSTALSLRCPSFMRSKKNPNMQPDNSKLYSNSSQMHSDQVFLNFTRLCNNPDQFSFPAMDIDDVKRFAKMVDKSWFFSCFTFFFFRWGRTSPLMASCARALRCTTSTSRSAQYANTHSESLRLRTFRYKLYLHQLLAGGQPGQDRDLLLLHQGDGLCN